MYVDAMPSAGDMLLATQVLDEVLPYHDDPLYLRTDTDEDSARDGLLPGKAHHDAASIEGLATQEHLQAPRDDLNTYWGSRATSRKQAMLSVCTQWRIGIGITSM